MKKIRVLLILLLLNLVSFGQSSLIISYGENIKIKKVEESTTFTIVVANENIILKGKEINNYKFKKPGVYFITVAQKEVDKNNASEEIRLPPQIIVNVSRVKMKFEGSEIKFSSPIKKNTETSGIVLSIPVTIETYDNKPVLMDFTPVKSSGIGSSITATLEAIFKQLSSGKHLLRYNLNGVVGQDSYLMFDFIDANGRIQSMALQSPIAN